MIAQPGGAVLSRDTLRVPATRELPPGWRLSTLSGRLTEISGGHASAALTLAIRLVVEAQRQGEPVAWISGRESLFYPPDVAEAAVDLEALVVVRVPETSLAARAADQLLRSGGFGLVVLDLGPGFLGRPPVQARLVGLARKHDAALVCLTEKARERPSLGSLVSLRAEAVRTRRRQDGDPFLSEARVLKDKRRGPGWSHQELCHGPAGLH
jgi:recombination protein RecA